MRNDNANDKWFPYYTSHGDPYVVSDLTRPMFTIVCKVDTGSDEYGRIRCELLARAPTLLAERDKLAAIVSNTLSELPVGNIRKHTAENIPGFVSELVKRYAETDALEAERDDLQATFDLMYAADMRGIKAWQEKNPGNDHVWPDRSKLTEWLLDERDKLAQEHDEAHDALESCLRLFSKVEADRDRLAAALHSAEQRAILAESCERMTRALAEKEQAKMEVTLRDVKTDIARGLADPTAKVQAIIDSLRRIDAVIWRKLKK